MHLHPGIHSHSLSFLMAALVHVRGNEIPVTGGPGVDDAMVKRVVHEFTPFHDWLEAIGRDPHLQLRAVVVQSVDSFGPRVGFAKFKADVVEASTGKNVPGIVFMRGGSVAMLVVLRCEETDWTILTVQPRVPVARAQLAELPAGMIDGSGHFAGVAAKELEEECGLVIHSKELEDLTQMAYKDAFPGILPSPGGCDEFIRCFLYRTEITPERLKEFQGKMTGLREEGEVIVLKVVSLADAWRVTSDAKTLCCLMLYEKLRASGELK